MVSIRWKYIVEAIKNGLKTFGDLPQTNPTMDRKHFLLKTCTNNLQAPNNLMNTKIRWTFINSKHTIQPIHSLMNTISGYVAILGDELDKSQRVLLSDAAALMSCFVSIGDKADTTQGNQQFLVEPGTEELKAIGSTDTYVSPALLGMANDEADPQIAIVSKISPLQLGESIPFGHSLKDPLPECTLYPTGFVAWFNMSHWAYTMNNKKPITSQDGGIFNNTNWERTLSETLSHGETVLSHAKGFDQESYILEVLPNLPTSQPYKSSFVSSEMSTAQKLDKYNYNNPPTAPQGQQGQPGQQGINATTFTSIGTAIATSVATAMTESNKKKTFVTKKKNTMLKLFGSYSSLNEEGIEVLVLGKFQENFEQVLNTKNKHKATVAFQSHYAATATNLANSSDLNLTSMHMDWNTETYNSV